MAKGVSMVVRSNHLPYLRQHFSGDVISTGEKHAKHIVEMAQKYSLPRYDTGAMYRGFTYQRTHGSEWTFLNEAESADGYSYPTAQELGFGNVGGLPMLIRAFDEEQPSWQDDLRKLPRLP